MRKCIWGVLCLLVLSLGGAFAALQLGALKLITVDPKTMKASPNRMTWMDDGRADKRGRCLSSAFEMPGQSWSQGFSAGGISVLPENLAGSVDPRSRGKALAPFLKLGLNNDVWVLVVDHFSPIRISLKETGTLRSYGLSHGSLVLDHLRAVLVGAGFTARSGNMDYVLGMSRVHLLKVEVGTLTPQNGSVHTAEVVKFIQSALRGKAREIGRNSNIVVNMSLALIPCDQEFPRCGERACQAASKPGKS